MATLTAHAGSLTLNFGAPQTLTTTAAQDAALEKLRSLSENPATGQPYLTIETWLLATLQSAIQSYRGQAREILAREACDAYRLLSAVEQQAIRDKLGGKDPCT